MPRKPYKGPKAWYVSEKYGTRVAIVFAKTKEKAKSKGLKIFSNFNYLDIDAKRAKDFDKYYGVYVENGNKFTLKFLMKHLNCPGTCHLCGCIIPTDPERRGMDLVHDNEGNVYHSKCRPDLIKE